MVKSWDYETWRLSAYAEASVEGGDSSKLRLTFKGSLDDAPQTIEVTGGCEMTEFFRMVRHLEARVFGSQPNTAQEVGMDEVQFAPR